MTGGIPISNNPLHMEVIEGGAETPTLAELKKEYPRVLARTAREGERCSPIKLFASMCHSYFERFCIIF